jgi:hypothetical protein
MVDDVGTSISGRKGHPYLLGCSIETYFTIVVKLIGEPARAFADGSAVIPCLVKECLSISEDLSLAVEK